MKKFIKEYKIKLKTLSPVFIGDGIKINKKEYIYNPTTSRVGILDVFKLYDYCNKNHLESEYNKFMMDKYCSAEDFVYRNNIKIDDSGMFKYFLNSNLAKNSSGKNELREILSFCKDPYGCPYVPGSSLKGVIRSALLAHQYHKNPSRFKNLKNSIFDTLENNKRYVQNSNNKKGNRRCLSNENEKLNKINDVSINNQNRFTENENENNDKIKFLSGLRVGDSNPLTTDVLTLSQKIDLKLNKSKSFLPIYRESLKPNTNIEFTLTIDESICNITIEDILQALDFYQQSAYELFYKHFNTGDNTKGIIWLGGGVGFLSKTIICNLWQTDTKLKIVNDIFSLTLGKLYNTHNHDDYINTLTPHVCKMTEFEKNLYEMGKCKIESFDEVI